MKLVMNRRGRGTASRILFMRVRSETSTNATTPLYKHEHMRLVARQDHGSYWKKKKTQRVAIKREYRIKGPMSLSQLSTGAGEFERNSQDRNTKRERRRSQTRDNYRSRSIAHFGSSMASRARQPREAGQRGDEEGEEMEK